MIFDTHVHYNLDPLTSEWKKYWEKSQAMGVQKALIVGTNFSTSSLATQLSNDSENLYASVGVHPIEYAEIIEQQKKPDYESLLDDISTDIEECSMITGSSRMVAIGEVGLDYYHLPKDVEKQALCKEIQRKSFEQFILLAKKIQKPLIIHVRDKEVTEEKKQGNAYWDALALLQKHDVQHFTLHCVSGPKKYVREAVEMGGYMGFDGNITYPNAGMIRELFQLVPETRRLLETDAPYLPPQEFRGKICEPWMISLTAEYCEKELHVDRKTFYNNAKRLFNV